MGKTMTFFLYFVLFTYSFILILLYMWNKEDSNLERERKIK